MNKRQQINQKLGDIISLLSEINKEDNYNINYNQGTIGYTPKYRKFQIEATKLVKETLKK